MNDTPTILPASTRVTDVAQLAPGARLVCWTHKGKTRTLSIDKSGGALRR